MVAGAEEEDDEDADFFFCFLRLPVDCKMPVCKIVCKMVAGGGR